MAQKQEIIELKNNILKSFKPYFDKNSEFKSITLYLIKENGCLKYNDSVWDVNGLFWELQIDYADKRLFELNEVIDILGDTIKSISQIKTNESSALIKKLNAEKSKLEKQLYSTNPLLNYVLGFKKTVKFKKFIIDISNELNVRYKKDAECLEINILPENVKFKTNKV